MSTRSNSPYVPSYLKAAAGDGKPVQLSYADFSLADTNSESERSYRYDPLDYPLKSTQQLNVDWANFENHCFFSSAEVKVNEGFNRLINEFPFDGTKKEVEAFFDSLTGFEKWLYDTFPRWAGALHFSGTKTNENPLNGYPAGRGTWIDVKDRSGNMFPDISKNRSGDPVLNPGDEDSITFETLIHVPQQTNGTQIVFQKASSQYDAFCFHLNSSTSTSYVTGVFSVSSGSSMNSVAAVLQKGKFNHVCLVLNKRDTRENELQFYINESLAGKSKYKTAFKKLSIDNADFIIGSGSAFYSDGSLVTPQQTFSGTLDEFRVFHEVRDVGEQSLFSSRGLYSIPSLKLYYRFNEPSGSLSINSNNSVESIVLDSSGNSLHSNIQNYTAKLRVDMSSRSDNLMVNEADPFKIVLFPAYPDVTDLNIDLLNSASSYDRENPNNIIKLIPKHYLLEGALQDGFQTVEGQGGDPYGGSGIPGQGARGPVQIILSFLYIWSKFFDEIKLYIDSFGTLRTVGYDSTVYDTVPDNFLEDLIKSRGFYLPKFFNHSTIDQYVEGQNLEGLDDLSTPLKKLQAVLTRRTMMNMNDIVRSKGTQHSIRSFLRSVGIDPDNSVKIREYGGPTTKMIGSSREKRSEYLTSVDFYTGTLVTSPYLSSSRVEPGWPLPAGSFVPYDTTGKKRRTGTTDPNDGLLTSGSWHIEGVFRIPEQKTSLITDASGSQSLFRLAVTGSSGLGLLANVVASQQSVTNNVPSTLNAYVRPLYWTTNLAPRLKITLNLPDKGLFDGNHWNVSLGRMRNDEVGAVSSSYYLRAAKLSDSDEVYVTSSYLTTSPGLSLALASQDALQSLDPFDNVSGSFLSIGKNQTIPSGPGLRFLCNSSYVENAARTTDFVGQASNFRFWSKSMSVDEWKEHVRNPKSLGVSNPKANYNFANNVDGSFQKIRLDTLQKQAVDERYADINGKITFRDFSLNGNDLNGTGFTPESKVVTGDIVTYSYISPAFDENATDEKIRVRSYQDPELVANDPWAVEAPTYLRENVLAAEEPIDDTRLSIEFSMVDSLDKDIINMFSSAEAFSDYLGRPELMFSPDYPDLEILRDVYFNRLSSKPDFRKFLEFYRWFDVSVSTFIEQLIPSKTLYKGTNYVVESHVLERHKNMYKHVGNYLGDKVKPDDSLMSMQTTGRTS